MQTSKLKQQFYKIKNLRLITPEYANTLGVPAEAPVLCSPYIKIAKLCGECGKTFTPLVYQIGQETTAQHFCKNSGGGIYVQLPEDTTNIWAYYRGLFQAVVLPKGPIRMGHDKGFTYESIIPKTILPPTCAVCHRNITSGNLVYYSNGYSYRDGALPLEHPTLLAACENCAEGPFNYNVSDWTFRLDSGELHFSRRLPDGISIPHTY